MRKLITILFVIFCQVSFGQVYQIMPQYGYSAPRFNTDSTLQLPTFNGVPTLKSNKTNKGAIAIDSTNGRFYFYNPKTSAWSQVTGGSSVDTTSLSNRINLKIDSLKRFNDTVYSYKNGSRTFAFKDSVGTNPAPIGYYGSFYDTTIQTAAAINTPYAMKLSNTDLSNGISISNNSRINIEHTGVYNIQFSAQFDRTNSGTDVIDIWLRKNGNNVAGSGGKIVLSGTAISSQLIASWNYVLNAIDNDYFEIMWSTPDTHVRLLSEVTQTSPFAHPNIPSVILTVTQQSGIMAGTGIQAADTTAMLTPYMKKNDSTIYYSKYRSDSSRTNIYSGINSKLNSSDSSVYYTKYRSDTSRNNIYSAINGKLNKSDSTIYYSKYSSDTSRNNIYSGINTKLAKSDTSTLSARIDLKLNISDTSNMLSKYLRKIDTATLSNRINLKLNIADTSTMLNPYLRKIDTSTLSTRINTKLAITDTSTLQTKSLASYSFQANKTNATANATANTFIDTSGSYIIGTTGTVTWNATAPTSLTSGTFKYTQIGKMCVISITLLYANAGSSTGVEIQLPSFCATPDQPNFTTNGDFLYSGSGMMSSSSPGGKQTNSTSPNAMRACFLKKNASSTSMHIIHTSGISTVFAQGTVTYFTN
jgi:hypothetical protein